MIQKQTIIKGAFILTLTSMTTRFIGFFYRIFLSRSFGEEAVGLYQLVFPVYGLCMSLCAAGIQTAVSRNVAAKASLKRSAQVRASLYTGMAVSFSIACVLVLILQQNASYIAHVFLNETRCAPLLLLISYALPFSAVHSCICGYYIGLKQTKIPAAAQLLEQLVRVGLVFFLYQFYMEKHLHIGIAIAVIGLVAGEIFSCLFCLIQVSRELKSPVSDSSRISLQVYGGSLKEIMTMAAPLTGNRILLNILQSMEAVSIPVKLQAFGFSIGDSLGIYGVLTGMALPCVMFPSAITNSIATMLLPTVAEMQALHHRNALKSVVRKVFLCCFTLGLFCCGFLLLTGGFLGQFLFHSAMAGQFIRTLAWICPFLYTNGNLISILNGLGKTNQSFAINTAGLLIRIAGVFFAVPLYGIRGYLWGMLSSQLVVFLASLFCLYRYMMRLKKNAASRF